MFVLSQNSERRAATTAEPSTGLKNKNSEGLQTIKLACSPFFYKPKPVKMEFTEKAKEGRRRYAAQYRKIKKEKMHAHQNRFYEKMADELPAGTPKVEQSR